MNHKKFKHLFGKTIRFTRIEKGLTIEELAYRVEVDKSTIERTEHGKTDPGNSTVFALVKVLEIDISEVYKRIQNQLEQDD